MPESGMGRSETESVSTQERMTEQPAMSQLLALLDALMENAPLGIAFFDEQHRYVRINQKLADINGYPVHEHLGRSISEVLPIHAETIGPVLEQVFQTGEPVRDLEITGTTPAAPGVTRTWLNGFYPIMFMDKPMFVGVVVLEVSERKRTAVALEQSQAQYRATFENAAVGVAHISPAGQWLNVNQRLCDLLGYNKDEMQTFTKQSITHPDDLPATHEGLSNLNSGKNSTYNADKRFKRKDGTYVWVSVTVSRVVDPISGETIYFISIIQDISDRVRVEERLRLLASVSAVLASTLEYEESLQSVAEQIVPVLADWCSIDMMTSNRQIQQLAVAHVDPAKVEWARRHRERFPIDLDRPHGVGQVIKTGKTVFYPEITEETMARAGLDEHQKEAIRQVGMRSALIVPLQARDQVFGALTLVWADSKRHYDESDIEFAEELAGRAAIVIDNSRLYSDARRAENHLRILNTTLEQRVAERTEDLDRSNRELQEFAYVASHDLQEPLRKIVAFSDRLQDKYGDELDSTAADYIGRMQNAATRMQNLINDLLSLSRVTTRGQPFATVDLNKIAHSVVDDLETVIEEAQGHVQIKELPMLEADPLQMRQLLQNLLSNALKFRRPTVAPHIRIYSERLVDPETGETKYSIFVSDNGIGFNERYVGRIFQPFQRLHGRTRYPGTGMGLAICRKIVERHAGSISVTSEEEQGTTFIVILPAVQPIRQRELEAQASQ